MSNGRSFASLSTLALVFCASRPSLDMAGSETSGVTVVGLGIDVVDGLGLEVEVAGAAKVEEACGRMVGCSAGTLSEAVGGIWDLVISISWVASILRSYLGIGGTSAFSHKAVMRHGNGSKVCSWFARMPISGNISFPISVLKSDMIEAIRI